MNSYPSYKDTGVEWIGEIPISWNVVKIKWISTLVTDGSHFSPIITDEGKLYVTVSDVTKDNKIEFENCKKISNESFEDLKRNGSQPNVGDVLITKDGTIGRGLVVDENDFVILSSLGLIRCDEDRIDSYYLLYYLLSGLCIDQMYSHIRGSGITRLTIKLIKNLITIVPPPMEQTYIVEYLDQQTKKIDELIERTEQKIELLKEKRTSLINHCVTKGLNPDVEMKDSGVEWIGEIPIHWNIKPLFSQCYHTKQKNDIDNKNVLSLSYGRIVKRNVETNFGLLPESFDSYQLIEKGFVILRLTDLQNDKKSLRVGFCEQTGIITPVYVSLNCYEWFDNKFLFYQLYNSDLKKVLYTLGGGLRQTLRFDELKRFPLSVCSKDEQTQIVEHLDGQTQKIDTTIEKETQRIELLKEYRQSLISEVVTGKVDVRGWNGN